MIAVMLHSVVVLTVLFSVLNCCNCGATNDVKLTRSSQRQIEIALTAELNRFSDANSNKLANILFYGGNITYECKRVRFSHNGVRFVSSSKENENPDQDELPLAGGKEQVLEVEVQSEASMSRGTYCDRADDLETTFANSRKPFVIHGTHLVHLTVLGLTINRFNNKINYGGAIYSDLKLNERDLSAFTIKAVRPKDEQKLKEVSHMDPARNNYRTIYEERKEWILFQALWQYKQPLEQTVRKALRRSARKLPKDLKTWLVNRL